MNNYHWITCKLIFSWEIFSASYLETNLNVIGYCLCQIPTATEYTQGINSTGILLHSLL